ncbi:hypothetical protein M0R45_036432 [Rubus argutus]|uniref:Uncharacterized protein n=1 Tax=Rubus argutus TaxID=59490 RepID=A0AAW1W062_RUBAR
MGVFHAKHLVSTTASSKDDDPPCARNGAIVCMVSPASVTVIIRQCPVVHSVKCKDSSWQRFTFTLMLEGKPFTDSAAKCATKSLLFQTINLICS